MSQTFSPRVVGRLRPDFYSLETLLASPPLAGKTGEQLVLAVYDYFTSRADGTYHFWPSDERKGSPRIRWTNSDPVKLLNCYGWTICGQASSLLYGLYRAAGLPARQIGLPGHSLCEVSYDGLWHVLDVDMWTWFRTPEGHIASAVELAGRPTELILDNASRSDPCNLPDRSLKAYAEMYAKTETVGDHVKTVCPHWAIRAHSMDFRLRPGETLIRSQEHQGRFHMPAAWKEFMGRFQSEWHGHPRERYDPFRTFGNGRWIYQPDLTEATEDFPAGVWEPSDLGRDETGLIGPGSAVFRVQSPYPFCGRPNWQGPGVTACDGVWVAARGQGKVQVQVTDAEGAWQTVLAADGAFDRRADVTDVLDGRYDCLLRLRLDRGARLNRLRFEGFLMTAPLSLPRLAEGANPMELRCLDAHGLPTVPWTEVVDFRAGADLAGRCDGLVNARCQPCVEGWQMLAPTGDGPVQAVFRFDAPGGRRFAWAYVHVSMHEGPPDQPPRRAMLEFSADGRSWQPLAEGPVPNTPQQWDGSIDGQNVFGSALAGVLVRVTSGTAVTGVQFHGHLLQRPCEDDRLVITHRWREGQAERAFQAPAGATRYTVACGPDPRGHTIEMHVPSRPAP